MKLDGYKFLLSSGICLTVINAELIRYEFNITKGLMNPDCSQGVLVPHINGQFPGPAIYAQEGDELEILVRNQMTDFNTSIHYHGIKQIGTVESDGVPGVTQLAIMPNKSYLQRFKVTQQAGTFFYHAHVGLQDDSVQGSFIVYESDCANPKRKLSSLLQAGPYNYKKDLILQLSEWWHEELSSRQDYYMSSAFTFDHGADSILMNGRTIFDPDTVDAANCPGYTTFDVEPNSQYRLRVIGAHTFRTLGLAIKQHNMTIIEVDGELVNALDTSFLEVTPGQRFSVLLKTGDYPAGTTFAIGTSYLWRQRGRGITENGFGFIRYVAPGSANESINHTHMLKKLEYSIKPADEQHGGVRGDANRIQDNSEQKEEETDDEERCDDDDDEGEDEDEEDEDEWDSDGDEKENDDNEKYCKKKKHSYAKQDSKHQEFNGKHGPSIENHGSTSDKNDSGDKGTSGDNKGGNRTSQRADTTRGEQGGGGGRGGPPIRPEKIYPDLPDFPKSDVADWLWHNITLLAQRNPIVDAVNVRTIKLQTTRTKMADNTSRYLINSRLLPTRMTPLLREIYNTSYSSYTNDDQQFNEALQTYHINYFELVDFVFQNTKDASGGCLLHPWHTHGHSHYVIASGEGDYNHETDKDIRNFEYPMLKDTTVVYPSVPSDDSDGCGWTKVRILADNPGFWAVHCHITTHMMQGKMIVLEEAPEKIEQFSIYSRRHS